MSNRELSSGGIYDRIRLRRSSNFLIALEAVIIGAAIGGSLGVSGSVSAPTAWGIGLACFVGTIILFKIPLIGPIIGLAVSVFWGYFAYSLGTSGSLVLGIVLGAVVFLISTALHLDFSQD